MKPQEAQLDPRLVIALLTLGLVPTLTNKLLLETSDRGVESRELRSKGGPSIPVRLCALLCAGSKS